MAKEKTQAENGFTLPIWAMVFMSLLAAALVGASFEVIKFYPLPVSVEPYLNFSGGAVWGLIAGAISGFVLGFLTDDSHFRRK